MPKLLAIFLALFTAMTVFGIVLVITRTGALRPRSIRALDWLRITGTEPVEEPAPVEEPTE